MRRLMLVFPIVAVFAAGWMLGTTRSQTADARPKPKPAAAASCKDDLTRVRRDLTASQGETQAARAEAVAYRRERDELIARERERLARMEAAVGTPVEDLE